jgi:hypothetical protein
MPNVAMHDASMLAESMPQRFDAHSFDVVTLLHPLDFGTAMTTTTLSSRAFNQDASGAKKAAKRGPVFITDRGRPAHVLLSIEEYEKLVGNQPGIVELLAMPESDAIEFAPPRLRTGLRRPVKLG